MTETSTAFESPSVEGQQQPRRTVRKIGELFEMLRAPHPARRVTALKAIQAQPLVALSFGVSQGLDVIDVLISESQRLAGTLEWIEWLGTLDCFDDERVTVFFFELLANEEEPLVLFAAARHLEHVSWPCIPSGMEALLLNDANPMRARAASSVLKNAPRLSTRARVRLSLLSDGETPISLQDAAVSAAWVAELKGCFHAEAMAALEAQGEPAWVQVALLWENLTAQVRVWLLRWGSRDFLAMVSALLPQALRQEDRSVVLEGLRAIADLGETLVPEFVRRLAAPFVFDEDAEVREAAVRAGPPDVEWSTVLASEVKVAVRTACTIQLTKAARERAIPILILLFDSDNWEERANAAACLTYLGPVVIESVRPLVHHQNQNVRAAALRILLDLEEHRDQATL